MRSPALLFVALVTLGCSEPSSPTSPTFTITGSVHVPLHPPGAAFIAGPAFLLLGAAPAQYIFTVQTGLDPVRDRVQIEKVGWRTDDERIARIDLRGRLMPAGPGVTRVRASFQGLDRELRVRIAPDVGGVWEGGARITSCRGVTCDFRTCGRIVFLSNPQREIRLTLSQRETALAGQLNTDRIVPVPRIDPITGVVRDSGATVLEGGLTTGTPPADVTTRVSNLVATLDSNLMRGGFSYHINRPFFSGCRDNFQLEYEFDALSRISR